MIQWMLLLLMLGGGAVIAIWQPWVEPGADSGYDISVKNPALAARSPSVVFDHGHQNVHSITGRFKPFADLLRADGCRVRQSAGTFSASMLADCDLLVVVNASAPERDPAESAFRNEEIEALKTWVQDGGALLLVADHHPYGPAAARLAEAFDVKMFGGWCEDPANSFEGTADAGAIAYRRSRGALGNHSILNGANPAERIETIVTFTGQSLAAPENATALLLCASSAVDLVPVGAKSVTQGNTTTTTFETKDSSAAGHCQALAMDFGKGRVVVLGEAAMLSAQIDATSKIRFGMNVPGCDNKQFVLNTARWLLSRDVDPH